MVERPWFYLSASLVRHLLIHKLKQRLEDVDKIAPHPYVAPQPPCYRCTYVLLLYLHCPLVVCPTCNHTRNISNHPITVCDSERFISQPLRATSCLADRIICGRVNTAETDYPQMSHGKTWNLPTQRHPFPYPDRVCDDHFGRYDWSVKNLFTVVARASGILSWGHSVMELPRGNTG